MNKEIEKVSKYICKIGDMIIEHVSMKYTFDKKTAKDNSSFRIRTNKTTRAGSNGLSSIYIGNTFDKIILRSTKDMVKNENVWVPPPSIQFGYGDFNNLKIALDSVKEWFTDDKFRNELFLYSTDSKPISVSSKYADLNVKFKSHSGIRDSCMQIEPHVVSSFMDVERYPGILIRGESGIIGTCTYIELFELRIILLDLLKNLYSNSLNLLLLGSLGECKEE